MTENWINFTDADVFEPNSQERLSIVAVKGRDDLADICGEVVTQIQQAYAFASRDLGPAGTIPEGLKMRAVAIALWRFVSEGVAKNEGIQTKQRESAAKEAVEYLERVAEVQVGKTIDPSIDCRHRHFKHEDGI